MTKFRFRMRRMVRAAIPVATLVAVSALVIACGSSKPPQTAQPTGTTPSQSTTTQPTQAPTQTTPTTPAQPMKQLTVPFGTGKWQANVVVTVPRTWQLAKTQPQSCCMTPPTRCIVEAGSDYAGSISNCRLAVTYASAYQEISPNAPPAAGLSGGQRWSTVQESNATIAGRPGEYRRFINQGTGAQFEQWTVMTSPQVAFFHQITAQSSHALVAGIVASAVLPPQTDARRPMDVGYIRQISRQADGYHLRLDRVVPNMDGTIINYNPATYDYRLDGLISVTRVDRCDHWGDFSCNLTWLLRQFAKGPHPADGSFAVDGAYARVDQEGGGDYRVTILRPQDQPYA